MHRLFWLDFFLLLLLEPEFIFIMLYFQHMDSDLQSSESLTLFLPSSEN